MLKLVADPTQLVLKQAITTRKKNQKDLRKREKGIVENKLPFSTISNWSAVKALKEKIQLTRFNVLLYSQEEH